jgi:hypothetical protein
MNIVFCEKTFSGKLKEDGFEKRQCSLHIAAWSIPFVLTTILFVTNVIEADTLAGERMDILDVCLLEKDKNSMVFFLYGTPQVPWCCRSRGLERPLR